MESRLRDDIPELQWEDLAENWGKIRICGTTRERYRHPVVVTIARNEPPGPFHLRIMVCTVLEAEAKAFHRAIVQRLQLSLLASTTGNTTLTDTTTVAPHPPPFPPPFCSLESELEVPAGREPSMALRIQATIPELAWADLAPDWEQVRIVGKAKEATAYTQVSITGTESKGLFHVWVHTDARSWPETQAKLRTLLERVRSAI
jgi:hypothetical protein